MKLHAYQQDAVRHLQSHPRAGLFLDMGLGKTAVVLSALDHRHFPVLVVAPKRVAETVWPAEQQLWRPGLTLRVAQGTPKQRQAALRPGQADIVVIGRDNVADAVGFPARTLVLDELSGFKNRGSKRWKTTKLLANAASHVWGLTGTPSPNGLLDLWAQMFLLDRGAALGATLTAYRSRYFTPGRQLANGVITEWLPRAGAPARIHSLLEPICLSMGTEGRIDLPPVTFNRVRLKLPHNALKAYSDMKEDLVAVLDLVGDVHTAANAAVLSGKLSQVTAGFMYSDAQDGTYTKLHDEKTNAVKEIVEGTGSPVLVFYRFTAELEQLTKAFPAAVNVKDEGAIDRWNAGQVPVMLAHPASAGHGLNLQHGGHTVVWTSLPWSLEEWAQANKRLARQGQLNPVVIHVLEAQSSVDGAIWHRLQSKESAQTALLRHLEITA